MSTYAVLIEWPETPWRPHWHEGNEMIERIYIASIEQLNAINLAAEKQCNQQSMAKTYRDCLIADATAKQNGTPGVDWLLVNQAIIKHWPKGLLRIKTKASTLLQK